MSIIKKLRTKYIGFVLISYWLTVSVQASSGGLDRQESMVARRALTQATILQKSGKPAEAITLLKEKFPNGPPAGDLAVAYYKIIASTPNGWNEARLGLEALVKSDRKNLQYALALDQLLGSKKDTRDLAFKNLANQYKERKVDKQKVLQIWREVLNVQESGVDLIPYYEAYLSVDPYNQEITGKWRAEKDAQAERKRVANDPLLRHRQEGLDFLDRGDLTRAEPPLQDTLKVRPNDYFALGGLGLIRMRQGRYEEAINYYQQALKLNPQNSGKWEGLIITSQYWLKIHQAEESRDAKNYPLALQQIRGAIELQPQSAEAIAVLGTIEAELGNSREAERYYREAINVEPDNGIAIRGLVGLLLDQDKSQEARALIDSTAPASSPEGRKYDYLRVKIFTSLANKSYAKGDSDTAIRYLIDALKIEPANPWVRYQLAETYQNSGFPEKALAVMKAGLQLSPNSSEMINANVLYLLGAEKTDAALSLLKRSLSKPQLASTSLRLTYANVLNREKMDLELAPELDALGKIQLSKDERAKFDRISLDFRIRQAMNDGNTDQAMNLLNQAIALDPDEVWLRLDLARLYAQKHQPQKGIELFENYQNSHPHNAEGIYAYALYLSGIEQNLAALKKLESLQPSERTPKIVKFQRSLWVDLWLTQVRALNNQGDRDGAISRLDLIEDEVGHDPDLSALVAIAWSSIGLTDRGNAIFDELKKQNQQFSVDWHLRYANYLLGNNDDSLYQSQMQLIEKQTLNPTQKKDFADLQQAFDIKKIGLLIQDGDIKSAKQKLQPLMEDSRNNYKVMYLDSQIQRREGYLDQAIDIEQRALSMAPVPLSSHHSLSTLRPIDGPMPSIIQSSQKTISSFQIEPPALQPSAASSGSAYQYKQVADMIDMRTNWIDGAVDYLALNGTAGQSYYRATEIPMEWKMPLRSDERMIFRADQVNINAGSIDASNNYQVSTFGSLATCATRSSCPTSFSNQSATGTALNIGYEKQGLKADIGTTPIGFLTQNWIGGIRQKGDLGALGYSLEVSRRPMTSTLLSYAGTRDPVTGAVWGGVIATGATASLSLDQGGTFGGWTFFRARSLTGTNVQSNSDNQFMVGLNWRIINQTDRLLSSGLTGMLWGFRQNVGEFTYGQGGYYSPQSYRSVTLPLNYSQRFARFSYVIGGTITSNWSRTDAAPYFPTNPAYQAAAGNPYFSSSSGPGSAYSVLAAWEYQVAPAVFVGNRLKLERSPYYAPNSFVLYVRIALDETAPYPASLQSQPVIPTSRF